jgi:broad specificity phosphatase PhoE
MMIVHLIRHGVTDRNGTHYIGRSNPPLNATGLAQAEELAGLLGSRPIHRLFSSPLQRAVQTATPLSRRLGVAVVLEPALMEFDFGDLQDLPKTTRDLNLRRAHATTSVPGGESLHDLWWRLRPFVLSLLDRRDGHGSAETAIVSHYWSNRMLLGQLQGRDFEGCLALRGYKPDNASVETVLSGLNRGA